jgi:hypothetical protein
MTLRLTPRKGENKMPLDLFIDVHTSHAKTKNTDARHQLRGDVKAGVAGKAPTWRKWRKTLRLTPKNRQTQNASSTSLSICVPPTPRHATQNIPQRKRGKLNANI